MMDVHNHYEGVVVHVYMYMHMYIQCVYDVPRPGRMDLSTSNAMADYYTLIWGGGGGGGEGETGQEGREKEKETEGLYKTPLHNVT